MARLPEDLITTDIIPRLPAKSIGRFRCVSKPWRSLLSSSKFVKSHLQIHRNDPEEILLRANYGSNGINSIELDSKGGSGSVANLMARQHYAGLTILQLGPSCDGLVLTLLRSDDHTPLGKYSTVLMNPVTRESVDICNHNHDPDWRFGLGFGYDKVNDDYKVVALTSGRIKVEVYSLRRKAWRSVFPGFPYHLDMHLRFSFFKYVNGVFANNGYIYWRGGYYYHNGEKICGLAAFNLASEELEKVPLPSGFQKSIRDWFETCVLDGFLAIVDRERDFFDVWVMKEHGVEDSWTNFARIEYPVGHVDGQNIVGESLRVVGNLHGDEIVTFWGHGKFFSYNMKSHKWRFLDIADLNLVAAKEMLTPFRGSLVSLNYQEEEDE